MLVRVCEAGWFGVVCTIIKKAVCNVSPALLKIESKSEELFANRAPTQTRLSLSESGSKIAVLCLLVCLLRF